MDGQPRVPRAASASGARAEDLDHPDELRVDLDPVPGVEWRQVQDVASVVRATLADLGLVGWPKTSGSRGIHVNVRIHQRWTFTEVRRAAVALAREVERRAPAIATSKWWKEERHGVFIDYNQNAKDRTVCSAFSVRPRPDARVSTPLTWEEIDECDPADFTLKTMPAWFKANGDRHAEIDRHPGSLEALLELSARQEKEGQGDAPWPPQYAKQPGEPTRVQPSRARKARHRKPQAAGKPQGRTRVPKHPLIMIAHSTKKDEAIASWRSGRTQHPAVVEHLQPADILTDSMRGRSSTWTRVRINLQHVPEELRPQAPKLPPIPNPWSTLLRSRSRRIARCTENGGKLVSRSDLELIVAAVRPAPCPHASAGTSPHGGSDRPACGRTSLRRRARCAAAPTTDLCPRSIGSARPACAAAVFVPPERPREGGPFTPGMRRQRVLPQRLQLLHQLLAPRHRERRGHADVMQRALVVEQAEQQRADDVRRLLVPAKSAHHAIGGSRVLDLEHRPLAGLIRRLFRLGNHPVEAGAFETLQPLGRHCAIACHRRQVERRLDVREQLFERVAPLALRPIDDRLAIDRQQIEGDERRRHPFASFATRDAAG